MVKLKGGTCEAIVAKKEVTKVVVNHIFLNLKITLRFLG